MHVDPLKTGNSDPSRDGRHTQTIDPLSSHLPNPLLEVGQTRGRDITVWSQWKLHMHSLYINVYEIREEIIFYVVIRFSFLPGRDT